MVTKRLQTFVFYENPKKYPEGALKMNFLDNHDENSWNRIMVQHFKEKCIHYQLCYSHYLEYQ